VAFGDCGAGRTTDHHGSNTSKIRISADDPAEPFVVDMIRAPDDVLPDHGGLFDHLTALDLAQVTATLDSLRSI
jgi:hypothetical protein